MFGECPLMFNTIQDNFYIMLLEPKTAILGGPDIHLKEGSTMNLTCVITDSPEPPSYIFWRHDDTVSKCKNIF